MANKRALNLLDSIDPTGSDSDSDDVDYTLPDARPAKKSRRATDNTSTPISDKIDPEKLKEEEEKLKAEKRRKGEEEWSNLMRMEEEARAARSSAGPSSLQSPSDGRETQEAGKKVVKVVQVRRPRNFAGEVIYETVSLPVDHPDVKRYGTQLTPVGGSAEATIEPENSTADAQRGGRSTSNTTDHDVSSIPLITTSDLPRLTTSSPITTTATATTTTTVTPTTSAMPRPAPPKRRKPRQSLESMNAELVRQAGIKKMSTFEKSQLDWASLTSTSTSLSTELEANRRTGGFLEKQDFLGRVGERKDDKLSQGSGGRRRAG